jgi:Tol biopolymer transport system component
MSKHFGRGVQALSARGNAHAFCALPALLTLNLVNSPASAQAPAHVLRISVSQAGVQGNNDSYGAAFSPDGTQVLFYTQATNLFPTPDPNIATYVAAKTLATGAVTDLAVGTPTGVTGTPTYQGCTLCETHPAYSADGTELIFYAQKANGLSAADTSGMISIYLKNVSTGAFTLISSSKTGVPANGDAYFPQISAHAVFALFSSGATNLIPGKHEPGYGIFEYKLGHGLSLVSTTQTGTPANGGAGMPSIAPDGLSFAFLARASNLATVPAGATNIFIKNMASGAVRVASSDATGAAANGLSTHAQWCSNGNFLAFESNAASLGGDGKTFQIYKKDIRPGHGELTLVSTDVNGVPGNDSSSHPAWSPDCTRIAMDTRATNFATGVPAASQQIAVKNLVTGAMTIVSLTPAGVPATGNSNHPGWSPDGTKLVFESSSNELVAGDTNNRADVFLVAAP